MPEESVEVASKLDTLGIDAMRNPRPLSHGWAKIVIEGGMSIFEVR